MDYFKLLLIVTYVVRCCKALHINEYKGYYLNLKESIVEGITSDLHQSATACLKCVYTAVLLQIKELDKLEKKKLSDQENDLNVIKCENVKKLFDTNFKNWIVYCTTSFPINSNITHDVPNYSVYFTKSNETDFETLFYQCTANFVQSEIKHELMTEIQETYQDFVNKFNTTYESSNISQNNKTCLNCIRSFIEYDLQRVKSVVTFIENNPENYKTLVKDHEIVIKAKEVYRNYIAYNFFNEYWTHICLKNYPHELVKHFEINEPENLIKIGNTDGLTNCIFTYVKTYELIEQKNEGDTSEAHKVDDNDDDDHDHDHDDNNDPNNNNTK
ncbi:uncharacterized protein LOC142333930 [Lycorma delicatula]|uniref:uncharacterized protein LOC142333930 n=1 Tax=Lycorma delicatula TaxID=130591 RepID=UPI003F5134DA